MKIDPIPSSEITPEKVYLNRRQFLKAGFAFGVGALAAAACRPDPRFEGSGITGAGAPEATSTPPGTPTPRPTNTPGPTASAPDATPTSQTSPTPTATGTPFALSEADELGDPLTDYHAITNYNNYFEFTHWKEGVANLARNFQTSPWDVQVGGLVHNPRTYAVEDLLKKFTQEERVYRLRCVEAWSMVIPWIGFELGELLKEADPMTSARYVRFEALADWYQMQGTRDPFYPWPYTEGLRLDEAMHGLTILATGLYGQILPNQNGAPLRLVVPWKYGFKSIKAIIKIDLVEEPPATLWSTVAPNEYGFYANVNPNVSHPRWSQASERRIGETGRRRTLLFNGYEEQVAHLYAGMDLQEHY